jgi:3-dehydroquinate dehydratase type I
VVVASLGRWPYELTDAALIGVDAVEMRLDLMGITLTDLANVARSVASRASRMIATCRPGGVPEPDRVALLVEAVRLGVWAVDIEVDAPVPTRAAVVSAARSRGCRVIVSHHDFERTPSRGALQRIVRRALAAGADFVKIACRVRILADNATLLGLLDDQAAAGRVAVLGMGPLGRVSRAVAPLVGSPLAYVAFESGLETADGQMTREALLSVWSVLEDRS